MSQLDLSLEAGVSQKHVSFIESGCSRPSPQMVTDLAEALHVPLRERNAILLAAGHALRYAEAGLEASVMERVTTALRRMLHQNEPFPEVVMDRTGTWCWPTMRRRGSSAASSVWRTDRARATSCISFSDPAGLRPFVVDWPATARMLLARIHREAPGHATDACTRQLLDQLGRYPEVVTRRVRRSPTSRRR